MKKIIIILFLLSTSFLNAQVKTIENLGFSTNEITKSDSAKSKDFFSHHSVSVGGGFLFGGDSKNNFSVLSISTTVHFTRKFQMEFKYDYCRGLHYKLDRYNIASIIPQLSYNLYEDKLRFLIGIGLAVTASKDFGFAFPTGNAKFEYKIFNFLSVNTETVFFPVMQKINFSYYLPY
ncbi:MAG: hypothetical protein HY959_08005 [Ignavibacteriae bacterium]|nr:hypothetical protein [Ignavibacteriota bacterium]